MTKCDLSDVPDDAIKEVHRQGELCLIGTMQLAMAADSRATTFTGIIGGATIALLAASAAAISSGHGSKALLSSFVMAAIVLLFATVLCARATEPQNFFVGGYEPKLIASTGNEAFVLRRAAEDLQLRIDHNRSALERSARQLAWGRRVALACIPAAVIAFFVAPRFF